MDMAVIIIFWDVFLELCKKVNKSPNAVCKELGFSTAAATHWKNGKWPRHNTLIKIADYFDVSVNYLMGNTDIKKEAAPTEQPISPKQKILLDVSAEMTDEDINKLIEYADLLNLRRKK